MRKQRMIQLSTCLVVLAGLVIGYATPAAAATITTEDLSGPLTQEDLAQVLTGEGVTVTSATYTGAETAAGKFQSSDQGTVGFDDGIILSSGTVGDVVGPNDSSGTTTGHGTAGDTQLSELTGNSTHDAAVLEFTFVPNAGQVFFKYVFSSEEYNEWVNSSFDDVFAFFVNGENCATVDGDRVSVNTINNGNPYGSEPNSHPELFRNNTATEEVPEPPFDIEMDGLTTVLTCQAAVTPNEENHMYLAIADTADSSLDSNVFIQAESLTTNPDPDGCGEDGLQFLDTTALAGVASKTVHDSAEPLVASLDPTLAATVHQINCDTVVPLEDSLDALLVP